MFDHSISCCKRYAILVLMILLVGCDQQDSEVSILETPLVFSGTPISEHIVINEMQKDIDEQVVETVLNTYEQETIHTPFMTLIASNDDLVDLSVDEDSTSSVIEQQHINEKKIIKITNQIITETNIPKATMTRVIPTVTQYPTVTSVAPTPTPTLTPTQLPTPDNNADNRKARVPILMYHYIEPLANDADSIRRGLTVEPGVFRQQLAFLHAKGYTAVSLYDLTYYLAYGKQLPLKPIIFCFDDGYVGLYEYAVPYMEIFGYTGTVFVLTQLMDEGHSSYLTWDMAHNMYEHGWKIEPHSKLHVQLSDRPFELVQYQVLGSMQTVQAHIGKQPRYFSYPSGAYDQQVIDYLKAVGFWGAVTTEYGIEHILDEAYTIPRIRISNSTTIELLSKYLGED